MGYWLSLLLKELKFNQTLRALRKTLRALRLILTQGTQSEPQRTQSKLQKSFKINLLNSNDWLLV